MRRFVAYILLVWVLLTQVGCASSAKAGKGEVHPKTQTLTRKQRAQMPVANANGYETVEELRMIEYRIMYYKDRIKEAKKNKQYDRIEVYELSLKRYQRLRRQMTTLFVRIVRNIQSDF